jgi:hypothetical protein
MDILRYNTKRMYDKKIKYNLLWENISRKKFHFKLPLHPTCKNGTFVNLK